ncbi:hypothetical protein [Streptomyces sp. CT34]|uniref:hypothetical protein n=1 Tax=Streptomyces sp. CT34 TaxID=1553907 RepID=UPI0005BC5EBB|nr:hypothetical protein [Streptomyces sp. CT34]
MSDRSSPWTHLWGSGKEREVVLAVDYPKTGRPEAGFPDLAAHLPDDIELWETAPVSVAGTGGELSGSDWVDHWLQGVVANDWTVQAVMGFCASSPYASTLRDRIADTRGSAPKLVLFDPDVPQEFYLAWQFTRVIEGYLPELTPQEIAAAKETAERVRDAHDTMSGLARALLDIGRPLIELNCGRSGLDAARTQELFDAFRTYVSYQVGANAVAVADAEALLASWSTATAVSSSTPGDGAKAAAEELSFPSTTHADLLRSREVAEAVTGLLR